MKNPYKLKVNEYQLVSIHKDLLKVIKTYQKRIQRDSDMKFGRGKFKISQVYATKVLGGILK